jgi:hypothetical protein
MSSPISPDDVFAGEAVAATAADTEGTGVLFFALPIVPNTSGTDLARSLILPSSPVPPVFVFSTKFFIFSTASRVALSSANFPSNACSC